MSYHGETGSGATLFAIIGLIGLIVLALFGEPEQKVVIISQPCIQTLKAIPAKTDPKKKIWISYQINWGTFYTVPNPVIDSGWEVFKVDPEWLDKISGLPINKFYRGPCLSIYFKDFVGAQYGLLIPTAREDWEMDFGVIGTLVLKKNDRYIVDSLFIAKINRNSERHFFIEIKPATRFEIDKFAKKRDLERINRERKKQGLPPLKDA